MGQIWLHKHFNIGNQAEGKSRYVKDAILLPNVNCDITKAATNVTIDFSVIHTMLRKYLVPSSLYTLIVLQRSSCNVGI